MRHTRRRESFDGWFVNKDEGKIGRGVENSICWILVESLELLIAGDDLEIKRSIKTFLQMKTTIKIEFQSSIDGRFISPCSSRVFYDDYLRILFSFIVQVRRRVILSLWVNDSHAYKATCCGL
jgi:hypothetical protein